MITDTMLGSQANPNICLQVRKPIALLLLLLAIISCPLSMVLAELRQEGMVSYGTVSEEQTHQRPSAPMLNLGRSQWLLPSS